MSYQNVVLPMIIWKHDFQQVGEKPQQQHHLILTFHKLKWNEKCVGSRYNQHLPHYLRFNHINLAKFHSWTQNIFHLEADDIVNLIQKKGKKCDFLRSWWISVWSSGAGGLEGVWLPTTLSPLLPSQTRHTLNGSNASTLLAFFKTAYFWSMFPALIWRNWHILEEMFPLAI